LEHVTVHEEQKAAWGILERRVTKYERTDLPLVFGLLGIEDKCDTAQKEKISEGTW